MFSTNEITKNDYKSWKIIFKEYLTFYNSELTDSTIKSSWNKIINKNEQIYNLLKKVKDWMLPYITRQKNFLTSLILFG